MEYTSDSVESIYTVLKKFIYTATGYPTYTERKKFIKPSGNYATVRIMGFTNNGDNRGDEYEFNSEGILVRYKNFNVDVTLRLYGDGSLNDLISLEGYLPCDTEYEDTPYFDTGYLSLLKTQMITDVSVPIDEDNWEERAQCLMTFNTAFYWTETIGTLESVSITTDVTGDSSDVSGSQEIDSDGVEVDSDGN